MLQARAVLNSFLSLLIIFLIGHLVLSFSEPTQARNTESSRAIASIMHDNNKQVLRMKFQKLKFLKEDSDLYLTLFNEIVLGPDEDAQRSIKKDSHLSNTNITERLNQEEQFLEDYQFEKNFYALLAKHKAEIVALEIFVNGSRSDADFDLYKDLEDIEELLFQEASESQFGESLARSKSNLDELENVSSALIESANPSNGSSANSQASSSSYGAGEVNLDISQDQFIDIPSEACQLDSDLVASLQNYNQEIEVAGDSSSESNNDQTETGSLNSDGSSSTSATSKRLPITKPKKDSSRCTYKQRPGDIVSNVNLLGEGSADGSAKESFICIITEQIYTTRSSYSPSDVESIDSLLNDLQVASEEVIAESLAPHKLTGEFAEPNICKKSFSLNSLKLKFNLVKRPLINSEEVDSLTELNPDTIANEQAESIQVSENDAAQTGIDQVSTSGEINPFAFINSAQSAREQAVNQARMRSELSSVNAYIASNEILLSSLNNRMQSMLTYIESFQEIFESIQATMNTVYEKDICE